MSPVLLRMTLARPEDDWSIQFKCWQDKFLCYQVVYKSSQQLSMTTGATENSSGGTLNMCTNYIYTNSAGFNILEAYITYK